MPSADGRIWASQSLPAALSGKAHRQGLAHCLPQLATPLEKLDRRDVTTGYLREFPGVPCRHTRDEDIHLDVIQRNDAIPTVETFWLECRDVFVCWPLGFGPEV